jgi:hypothetical protein
MKVTRIRNFKTLTLQFIFCIIFNAAHAQKSDSMFLKINKSHFLQGDTLNLEIVVPKFREVSNSATIHLWIEDLKTGKKWHYRYPLLNGVLSAKLIIGNQINDGNYALNFLLQKKFFTLEGKLVNQDDKDVVLNYFLLTKNMQMASNVVSLDKSKSFAINNLLFQDSASIFFSKPKHKNDQLQIEIKTPLDSNIIAIDTITKFIKIGKIADVSDTIITNTSSYQFTTNNNLYTTIMPELIVKAKSKKLIDDYEKENVSGLFAGSDATVLDGLESDEIANANDLFNYLTTKVGGLNIKFDEEGNRELTWRKRSAEIYINEIKVDPEFALDIITSDIAMIKIFQPGVPVSFSSGAGGTIAIYLKNGAYKKPNKIGNHFCILGYTGLESTWK